MERKGFIGGSDCVKILAGDWQELWEVKTGRKESDDLSNNIAVQLGSYTEQFNLDWFSKQFGMKVVETQMEVESVINGVPAKGLIDGRCILKNTFDKDDPNLVFGRIIEAKHTNSFSTMDDVVVRYMPQVQLYCYLAGTSGCYMSVIFGNSKWESVFVSTDQTYFDTMWSEVTTFWGFVTKDVRPPNRHDIPSIPTDSIPLDNMVKRDASTDNQFMDAAVSYCQGYESNRVFESAKKQLKDLVKENEREVYCDQLKIKRDKRGTLRITKS